jgi:hypothetical protein
MRSAIISRELSTSEASAATHWALLKIDNSRCFDYRLTYQNGPAGWMLARFICLHSPPLIDTSKHNGLTSLDC